MTRKKRNRRDPDSPALSGGDKRIAALNAILQQTPATGTPPWTVALILVPTNHPVHLSDMQSFHARNTNSPTKVRFFAIFEITKIPHVKQKQTRQNAADPRTPEELLAHPNVYRERLFRRIYRAPKRIKEDTPLFSLYRLYEHLTLNDNVGLRNKLEYFWYTRWPVASIPDPQDPSKSRYAVLSAIPALLVESFNERINLGLPRKADSIVTWEQLEEYQKEDKVLETVPEWTNQVAPLEETLVIPHDNDEVLETFEDVRASAQLAAKNVLHWQPHIHFI